MTRSIALWRLLAASIMFLISFDSLIVHAQVAEPWPITLRADTSRLNEVGYKVSSTANELCPSTGAGTGLAIDYIEAYAQSDRPAIKSLLGLDEFPQIAAVAQGSPAWKAGVRSGESLIAINGKSTREMLKNSPDPGLFSEQIEQYLLSRPVGQPITLTLRDGTTTHETTFDPTPVCSARFIVKTGEGVDTYTDGTNVGISNKLIAYTANNDELALIAAHELGHIINRDGKARSLGERRAMEDRADIVGARLMVCAGYDLETGLQYWLRREKGDLLRWFRDPSHRSRPARVRRMRAEGAHISCPPDAKISPVADEKQ